MKNPDYLKLIEGYFIRSNPDEWLNRNWLLEIQRTAWGDWQVVMWYATR